MSVSARLSRLNSPSLLAKILTANPTNNVLGISQPSKIAVEFSSPNIAKPFHLGHLRSTLLGSFIARALSLAGHDVTRVNFLGDFGTQFALLLAEWELFGDEQKLQRDGVRHLYDVYVSANKKIEEEDEGFRKRAAELLKQLQRGDAKQREVYENAKHVSIDHFLSIYQRFHVDFDLLHAESDYDEKSRELVEQFCSAGLLIRQPDGSIGFSLPPTPPHSSNPRYVCLQSREGASLYLSRDLAAALHRVDTLGMQRLVYVVGAEQRSHFKDLKAALRTVERSDVADCIVHIPFRNVRQMSSRAGSAVFVEDFLEEGVRDAKKFILESPNARVTPENEGRITNALACGAWIAQDFRRPRMESMKFSWSTALRHTGRYRTGTFLQFSHARLCQLEGRVLEVDPAAFTTSELLTFESSNDTVEVQILQNCLLRVEEALVSSYSTLEPSTLLNYSIDLAHTSNVAYGKLRVIDDSTVNYGRLQLFMTTKRVLKLCMELLGFVVLDEL